MPQQLACPNCRMVVHVVEVFASERRLCPGCQVEMAPVAERDEEAIVAEPDDPPPMVAVELGASSAPMRPTVVVPHGPPPKFKPTPVAQAWTTVARGLSFQRWGVLIALIQPVGMLILLLLAGMNLVRLARTDDGYPPAAWCGFVLTYLAIGLTGALFVAGRLCCYRVPPRTGARVWMAVACASSAVATMIALLTSPAYFVPADAPVTSLLLGAKWVAIGLWLATEWVFLWALSRIGSFVKRPVLSLLSGIATIAAALVVGLWMALDFSSMSLGLYVLEAALAGLFVLYLFLLGAARSAVQTKTLDE